MLPQSPVQKGQIGIISWSLFTKLSSLSMANHCLSSVCLFDIHTVLSGPIKNYKFNAQVVSYHRSVLYGSYIFELLIFVPLTE